MAMQIRRALILFLALVASLAWGGKPVPVPNSPPTVSIISPVNGATYTTPGKFHLGTKASDSDGTIAKIEYVLMKSGDRKAIPVASAVGNFDDPMLLNDLAAGTYTLTAKATDNLGAVTASSPVSFTVAAATSSPLSVNLTSPASGDGQPAPANFNLAATVVDPNGAVTKVDFYQGTSLLGTSGTPPHAFAWTNVPAGVYSVTAKATANGGVVTTSPTVTVWVPHASPSVALLAPASGATFTAPATINFTATASDSDGAVTKVEFYAGATLLGTRTAAPYDFTWSNVAVGTYSLTAKATDNSGLTATTAPVSVTVTANTNAPPTVSLTSPTSGSTFTSPATINLIATAADANGTVSKVDFYQGAALLGTSTSAPYVFTWSNVAAGNYSLTARATDNGGAVTTSSAVPITVGAPNGNVLISSPANGASIYASSITVTGTFVGSSTNSFVLVDNGSSSRLAMLSGNSYTATVPLNLGDNTVTVTVARVDKTSDKASITVKGNSAPLVVFTSPTSATSTAPANLTLAVDAMSPGGTIASVNFFRNGVLLGTAANPPYQYNWANIAAGSYTILATAVDNNGQSGSASLPVQVGPPNLLPSVSVTKPGQNATFTAPATIKIDVDANDSDGNVALVEFLQNGNSLGASNVAPYTFTWTNAPEGNYALTARATDNSGGVANSPAINIAVNSQPPVGMDSSLNGATFTSPAAVTLSANTGGPALGVSFFKVINGNNVLIGDSPSTSSPYTYQWDVRTAGTYTVVARTYMQVQGFPTPMEFWSSPVTFTVNPNPAGDITYLHQDFAGSVIAATDSNGAVIWKEDYQPYGERLVNDAASSSNRQFFTGKSFDQETGLTYMGARYYDPAVGRFMGMDSVGFQPANVHSFNRYAYANNNPYRFTDPDGRNPRMLYLYGRLWYLVATEAGAGVVGSMLGIGLYNVLHQESSDTAPAEGEKRGPKTDPNAPHNSKIRDEAGRLKDEGNRIVSGGGEEKEQLVKTPGGVKSGRRPDIIYETPEGERRGRNIGRTKADGTPVPREVDALNDLNGPGKLPTDFVPYDR